MSPPTKNPLVLFISPLNQRPMAMINAARNGDLAKVEKMMKDGEDVNQTDSVSLKSI